MIETWDQTKREAREEIVGIDSFDIGIYEKIHILNDIKHFAFSLSRYKFVSKMVAYETKLKVLELGCNEALGSLVLKQNNDLEKYVGVDFDAEAIDWDNSRLTDLSEYYCADIFDLPKNVKSEKFNLVYSLDVIEHIDKAKENDFLKVIYDQTASNGCAIIGTPNISMDSYASSQSKKAHINLYNQKRLHALCKNYFDNVMMFGMNDEIVNVGFEPMTCYMFAVCTGKKEI